MKSNFNPKMALLTIAVSSCMLTACGGGSSGSGGNSSQLINSPPKDVSIMEVTSITENDISLTWLPAKDDTTPKNQIRYEVHASEQQDFTPTVSTKIYETKGQFSANIADKLLGGKTYYIILVAIDKDGLATNSKPMPIKVSDKNPISNVPPTKNPNQPITHPSNPTKPNIVENKAIVTIPVNNTVKVLENQITLPKLTEIPKNGGYIVSVDTEKPYLRRVVSSSVDKVTGETIVKTEQASLNEVVKEANISSTFKMSPLPQEVETNLQTGLIGFSENNDQGLTWQSSNYSYTAGESVESDNNTTFLQAGLTKGKSEIIGTQQKAVNAMTVTLPREITLTPTANQQFNISAIVHKNSQAQTCNIRFKGIKEVAGTGAKSGRISVNSVGSPKVKNATKNGKALDITQGFVIKAKDTEPLGKYDVEFEVLGDDVVDGCNDTLN